MTTKEIYRLYKKYPTITTDTRHCIQGSIFIALKGDNFNGNKFARTAIESGCEYAFVDEKEYADNHKILLMDKPGVETLQELANYHRRQFNIPVIAITGTNGKTTTKELIAAVLSQGHKVLYTQGNMNNHLGVPLTLLRMNGEHSIAIIEMGANHPGEIETLCKIAEPTFGLITNVGKAHLEGFGSFEGVIRTKGELYAFLQQHGGKVFLPGDNPYLSELARGFETITYGKKETNTIIGKAESCSPFLTYQWKVRGGKYIYTVSTQLIGTYNLDNILAAITVGRYFGILPNLINKAISEYTPNNNRSQLKKSDKNTLIIDAYNANPESMRVALENFEAIPNEHKVLILGDMKELGEQSDIEHQHIANLTTQGNYETIFLIGENFGKVKCDIANKFPTTEAFHQWLSTYPLNQKTILIKGSRGMKLESLLDLL